MEKTCRQNLLAVTFACAIAALAAPVAAQEQEDWQFDIAPYLWVANVGVETSLPQAGASSSSSAQKFDTRISGGFMMAAEARYRSVGVLVDFNWLRLNTEAVDPGTLYSGVNLRSDYIYTTAALTYTLPLRGKFHAEALAGAAIWHVGTDFDLQTGALPGFDSSSSATWASPLVGLNLRYDLTRHWLLLTRGTVGGFTDSDIDWDVFGGVGYQFNNWCMATVGYRYLHEEHNQDNFTLNARGLLVGVVFKF